MELTGTERIRNQIMKKEYRTEKKSDARRRSHQAEARRNIDRVRNGTRCGILRTGPHKCVDL